MEEISGKLSALAQVMGMAYVAYSGTAPEWLRWCFAVFCGLWLLMVVVNSRHS